MIFLIIAIDYLLIRAIDYFPEYNRWISNSLVNKLSDYKLNQTNPFYISSIKQ